MGTINKGRKMREGAMIFFIAAFVLFIATAFWFANRENTGATEAAKKADDALTAINTQEKLIQELKAEINRATYETRRLIDTVLAKDADVLKLKQKVEWLEMKANAQATNPNKPIQVHLVYREAKREAPKVPDSLKKKIKELTQ